MQLNTLSKKKKLNAADSTACGDITYNFFFFSHIYIWPNNVQTLINDDGSTVANTLMLNYVGWLNLFPCIQFENNTAKDKLINSIIREQLVTC